MFVCHDFLCLLASYHASCSGKSIRENNILKFTQENKTFEDTIYVCMALSSFYRFFLIIAFHLYKHFKLYLKSFGIIKDAICVFVCTCVLTTDQFPL